MQDVLAKYVFLCNMCVFVSTSSTGFATIKFLVLVLDHGHYPFDTDIAPAHCILFFDTLRTLTIINQISSNDRHRLTNQRQFCHNTYYK